MLAGIALPLMLGAAIGADVGGQREPRTLAELLKPPPRSAGPTAAISGVVIDGTTNQPVSDVTVTLLPPRIADPQRTDATGRFAFTDLPPNTSYTLRATHPQFLSGQAFAGDVPLPRINVTVGDATPDLRIVMWRSSAISGTVRDANGQVAAGIPIQLVRRLLAAGEARFAVGPVENTDDRGIYRFSTLTPGEYLVVRKSLSPGYPTTFFPDALQVESASVLTLQNAQEMTGIDFRLDRVPVRRVTGKVVGLTNGLDGLRLRLTRRGTDLGAALDTATTQADVAGQFAFDNVPVGDYSILVRRQQVAYEFGGGLGTRDGTIVAASGASSSTGGVAVTTRATNAPKYSATTAVSVRASDVSNVVVTLEPEHTYTLSGRVVWDIKPGAGPPAFLRAEPANGERLAATPMGVARRGEESFVVEGLAPGPYVIRNPYDSVSAITWQGRDYTNRPFDVVADMTDISITLTDKTTAVSGTVRRDGLRPASFAAVIAFPVEPDQWRNYGLSSPRIRSVLTTSAGIYRIAGLPAGEYFLLAVDGTRQELWQDAAMLARFAAAAERISLKWDQTLVRDLGAVAAK
jgi:hypothetical protein